MGTICGKQQDDNRLTETVTRRKVAFRSQVSIIQEVGRETEIASVVPNIRDIAPVRNEDCREETCFADFKDDVKELGEGRFLL